MSSANITVGDNLKIVATDDEVVIIHKGQRVKVTFDDKKVFVQYASESKTLLHDPQKGKS